jgi:hypothetical protein
MKRSLVTKPSTTALAICLLVWSIGCSSVIPVVDLTEGEGQPITVKTSDGRTYELRQWKSNAEGNITGEGRGPHASGHPSLTQPYAGTIPFANISSISYRLSNDESSTEAIVVITALAFFTLLSVIAVSDGPILGPGLTWQ